MGVHRIGLSSFSRALCLREHSLRGVSLPLQDTERRGRCSPQNGPVLAVSLKSRRGTGREVSPLICWRPYDTHPSWEPDLRQVSARACLHVLPPASALSESSDRQARYRSPSSGLAAWVASGVARPRARLAALRRARSTAHASRGSTRSGRVLPKRFAYS